MTSEFPVYNRNGLTVASGSGYKVRDTSGQEYLDFYGGHAVAILGHSHPALNEAIATQSKKLLFQTNAVDLDVREAACEALISICPEGMNRVFLVSSGAEAVENALRFAFQINGRTKVVALKDAFHGRTAAAATVTDHTPWYAFPQRPFEVARVAPNDLEALDGALDDDTTAFIVEPIQGLAGAVAMTSAFLQKARKLCSDRGIIFIADEVQSGMGRSGHYFAVQGADVVPDFLTVAKGIAGGVPAGALVASARLADSVKKGWLGTTFGGGPVASAAMIATVNVVKQPGFLENVREMSARLQADALVGPVTAIQGQGLLLGLKTSRPAKEVLADLLQAKVLAGDAKDPNVVRLLPPLTIDREAVDAFVKILKEIPA